jgi:branched-chain amino acid aminotransferase
LEIHLKKIAQTRIGEVDFSNLGFGEVFSDHMLIADYRGGAWQTPHIVPFGPIAMMPSMCSLHYGQVVFEGLKAFRTGDGGVNLFRPERYHGRFNRSNERLCIPSLSYEMFMTGLEELLTLDRAWIPRKHGCSLYIRPFIFATDSFIGVRVSDTYRFMIITCPVGAYYKEGINPVKLITSGEYVRAAKGGLGEAKTPANYAASLFPAEKAKEKGYTQVLWLDAVENRFIEEVGTMNIAFVIDGTLVTPPLDGSILGGVTRDTVILLANEWGLPVKEERISIDQIFSHNEAGRLTEVFGTGTAAVISPVGWIEHNDRKITINDGKIGEFSQRFYDEITGIQYGERPDRFGWCRRI